jgi:hypothetical protein
VPVGYTATTGAIATGTTAKTVLGLRCSAATTEFYVCSVSVSFDTITAPTAQMLVELTRTTTAGTSAASAPSAVPRTPASTTANAVGTAVTIGHNYSAEPTSTVLYAWFVRADIGAPFLVQFPLGREPAAGGATTEGIGVRITSPTGAGAPNACVTLEWEE